MKKLNSFAAVASLSAILTAAVSCSDDEAIVEQISQNSATPALKTMTFSAGMENNSLQKIAYNEKLEVVWSEDDEFAIFPVGADSKCEFVITSGAGTTKCEMEGDALEADGYFAFYPIYTYRENYSDGKFTDVCIYPYQDVIADQFNMLSDPLVAYTTKNDMSFNFRHVGAKLGVTVPIEGVKKITITCSEPISGIVNVAFSAEPNAEPYVEDHISVYNTVTLNCYNNNRIFQKGETYYATVIPTSKDADLTITCETSEGEQILYSGKIGPMLRNTRNMAAPPAEKGSKYYTLAALDKENHFPSIAQKIVFGYKKDYDVDALNLKQNGDPLGDIEFYKNEDKEEYYILSDKEICLTGDLVFDDYGMFEGYEQLEELVLDNFNTANVGNMSWMFAGCSSLTTLNLSKFNTANVQDMSGMFSNCTSLTTLDLTSFNTANVQHMDEMFIICLSLTTLDLTSFNTSIVETMFGMFGYCTSLTTLDLSSFNTAKVEDMSFMFNTSNLQTINVSNDFVMNSNCNTDYMFGGCPAGELTYPSASK